MIATVVAAVFLAVFAHYICRSLLFSPLARIPGPKSFALTSLRLVYEDYKGTRTGTLHSLHQKYGPVVRVGPSEVTFNSISALRTIYGAGSGFERTDFYHIFAVYGRKNMFSFSTVDQHAKRKKLFAHAYSKSAMLKGENARMTEYKIKNYLDLLEREGRVCEIFSTLHYFSLDNITQFLYGDFGKTACLEGGSDRALISDIMDPAGRRFTWFSVHLPKFTDWLYSQTGVMGSIAQLFYPMQTPTPYTGIRLHAMKACQAFAKAPADKKEKQSSLISKLWKHHRSQKGDDGLDDLDIASECADQLDGGFDTTSDTLMFIIWSLSRPEHKMFQQKLIDEVRGLSDDDLTDGIPRTEAVDKLPYLDAVIKETLRLYSPLPAPEPRSLPSKQVSIDGYMIPARTVVSISPYVLHRNLDVFKDPLQFNPDRWLDPSQDLAEMKKLFWAFSSGGRMCIGMQ